MPLPKPDNINEQIQFDLFIDPSDFGQTIPFNDEILQNAPLLGKGGFGEVYDIKLEEEKYHMAVKVHTHYAFSYFSSHLIF